MLKEMLYSPTTTYGVVALLVYFVVKFFKEAKRAYAATPAKMGSWLVPGLMAVGAALAAFLLMWPDDGECECETAEKPQV